MNFVDNHTPRGCEHPAPAVRAEENVKGLRGGYDDVGRAATHPMPFVGRRIPGPNPCTNINVRQTVDPQIRSNACKRRLQIALNII